MTAKKPTGTTKRRKAPPKRRKPADAVKLTDKQGAFALRYVVHFNATRAAVEAGYSEKAAAQQAWQLLQNPLVRAEVERLKAEAAANARVDAAKLRTELEEANAADLADLYDADGQLRPIHEWPVVWRRSLVTGIEVVAIGGGDDELADEELEPQGHGGALKRRRKAGAYVSKVRFVDPMRVKEMLGKHVDVQAFRERKVHETAGALAAFMEKISGNAIRPKGGR